MVRILALTSSAFGLLGFAPLSAVDADAFTERLQASFLVNFTFK